MKCKFIQIKLKDKNYIDFNNNNILEFFKLSVENNIINLNYNKNKKESSRKNLEIIYYKKYTKKNIGKILYKNIENNKQIQLFNKIFISNNIKIAKIIINNKQYELKEKNENKKLNLKIKIKFLDNIIYLDSMFENCKSLSSVDNLQNINTKYLKAIKYLFSGCSSLLYINDISNWNMNNINDINSIFCRCSSLKSLPNISKWDISKVKNISNMFLECFKLESLPDKRCSI